MAALRPTLAAARALRAPSSLASAAPLVSAPPAGSARSHYTQAHALQVLASHWSPAVPRAPKGNDIVCASARGNYVTDVSGRRYLDFQQGIGVGNTGHSHPRVVEAITRQIQDGIHLQQNCMISQPTVALCEKLLEVAPKGLTRFFFNCALGPGACACWRRALRRRTLTLAARARPPLATHTQTHTLQARAQRRWSLPSSWRATRLASRTS
jgi:hypothetical protein